MASVTSWTRLEPLPRTGDLKPALEARVADPLWLLTRQWQTLEFAGEDAGSPVVARIAAEQTSLSRIAFDGVAVAHDDRTKPLEAAIEAEPVDLADVERLRVEAGLHFLRLLAVHGVADMGPRYTASYAFEPGDEPVGVRGAGFRAIARGRCPDGARLFADLAALRGPDGTVDELPPVPEVPDESRAGVAAAANAWLDWYAALLTSAVGQAWDSRHLEYRVEVAAGVGDAEVVLSADEYADGHLDWHAFARRPDRTLGGTDPAAGPEQISRTIIPVPASYAGMPADRFWQFEDGAVNFGSVEAGPSDLTRLVLVEFALVYGNDWFVVPVDLRAGSLCTITSLEVVDTFGVVTRIGPVPAGDGWAVFALTGSAATADRPTPFFLPPTLAGTVTGDPIESVTLLRDEMANMVWAVEHTIQDATGDVVDRTESATDPGVGLQQLDGDLADAELVYRLATPVPDHWIPFVPVTADDDDGAVVLERRTLRRQTPGGPVDVQPLGRLLEPGRVLRVEEGEVPSEGAIVERSWQLARWTDGSTHLWLGRRKRVGRGEGRSGLRFDIVEDSHRLDADR